MNYYEQNRESWNAITSKHVTSTFYNLEGFKQGKSSLNEIELDELGEIKGKSVLHLQCHFGMDSLSLARLGANVTGIDISDESIKVAKQLSKELSIPATFYRANVLDADNIVGKNYDIVYTSYGALNWLEDLGAWAKVIYNCLKPGGTFYMVEFHPFVYTLGESGVITEPYFKTDKIISEVTRSYTENSNINRKDLKHVEWHHSISEVLNSIIKSGLNIKYVNEFPYQVYNCFDNMVELDKGKWVFKEVSDKIPYLYSVKAVR